MTTENAPAWRIKYAGDIDGPKCKSRDCAIASINPFEGLSVAGIEGPRSYERFEAPLKSGLRFRLENDDAVERAKAASP